MPPNPAERRLPPPRGDCLIAITGPARADLLTGRQGGPRRAPRRLYLVRRQIRVSRFSRKRADLAGAIGATEFARYAGVSDFAIDVGVLGSRCGTYSRHGKVEVDMGNRRRLYQLAVKAEMEICKRRAAS